MRKLIVLICLGAALGSRANEAPLAADKIPATLRKDAHVVKRYEEVRFEIRSLTETVLKRKYAVTVLDEQGNSYASLQELYDGLARIESIDGTLYDAAGKAIRQVRSKDITDIKAYDGMSLYDDNRVKLHDFQYRQYPYTVEYEIEERRNHTFYLHTWVPQEVSHLSVEQSRFTVVAPAAYKLRFRVNNQLGEPARTAEGSRQVLEWKVTSIPALVRPFASPVWHELRPAVFLAPSEFQISGYKGKMDSWADMGRFQQELNKGRDALPPETVQQVQQLVQGISSDREKVKVLYNFLQKNTRYISIQLGIGGWQPFEASYVAKKGYGDCKALSNYMYSLLKTAGIRSHYTIIRAGGSIDDRGLIEDFPSNQSNHIILCVPLQKDTLWLECTDQNKAAGYMGTFTGNRKALVVDEQGGTIVSLPYYRAKDNLQLRRIAGKVDENGDLKTAIRTRFTGIQQEDRHNRLIYMTQKEQKDALNKELSLSTYDIERFHYTEEKTEVPAITEELDLFVSRFATVSGKRLFLVPNLLNRNNLRLAADSARKVDFVFDTEFRDVDSVEIEVPAGYTPESVPQEIQLKTKVASYKASFQVKDNKVLYVRTIEQVSGRLPASEQAAIARFYADVYKADRARVVLVKKEE